MDARRSAMKNVITLEQTQVLALVLVILLIQQHAKNTVEYFRYATLKSLLCLVNAYLQPLGGCDYWIFNRTDYTCTTLDSSRWKCHSISGPTDPPFEKCVPDDGCKTKLCDENAQLVNSTAVFPKFIQFNTL